MMDHQSDAPVEIPAPEAAAEENMTVEERLSALAQQITRQMEKSAQEEKNRRTALDERETAIARREMLSRAREEMEKRGLPAALSECMAFADEDAMKLGINLLEECFHAAVQAAVEARLLDHAPKTTPIRPLSDLPDDEYYAAVCRTN